MLRESFDDKCTQFYTLYFFPCRDEAMTKDDSKDSSAAINKQKVKHWINKCTHYRSIRTIIEYRKIDG